MLSVSRQVVSFKLHKSISFIKCSKLVEWNIITKTHLANSSRKSSSQASYYRDSSTQTDRKTFLVNKNGPRLHETVKYLSTSVARSVSRKDYVFPEVKEDDVDEQFVRGSGPGGQSVNKTANCVVLKHLPTGIVVKCHETRSLETNRKRARKRLQDRLDVQINGENSFLMTQQREESDRRAEKKRRSRQRLEMKKAFKEEIGD